ncbi:hypothetical protein H4R19_001518 [Coemansia spiralis]|nr:hypothetical protein H4R19_001518 [Coemansia spiralis]
MLAAWAACCVLFGVSVSYLGAKQGWIKPATAEKQVLAAAAADNDDADHAQVITDEMLATAAARECLDNPDEWKRTPYFWPPPKKGDKSPFVPGAMLGPDMVGAEPVVFMHRDLKRFVVIAHIGERLHGHKGIVHGGVQATLFDEITARPAFRNLPRNSGLTASLKINYRQPAFVGRPFVFRTQLTSLDGRKATVTAQLEDDQGNVVSDAEALYVSPKSVALPDNSAYVAQVESVYPANF